MANSTVRLFLLALLALPLSGCSIKSMAINTVGNALAESGSNFSADDDPELIAAAIPFGLKTIEGLLAQSPKHKGLLFAACSGFTQYSYAFVQQEADYVEAQDLQKATEMRARAKKLYLRAFGYGMRAFDEEIPGFSALLKKDPDAALSKTTKKHVPLLYYTGAAWAAAFAVDVADSQLSVNQTAMEKIMRRALQLDEGWELGSLHDFFISWESGHASAGGSVEKAKEHFARAKELAGGKRVSPLVVVRRVGAGGRAEEEGIRAGVERSACDRRRKGGTRAAARQRAGAAAGQVAPVEDRRAVLNQRGEFAS